MLPIGEITNVAEKPAVTKWPLPRVLGAKAVSSARRCFVLSKAGCWPQRAGLCPINCGASKPATEMIRSYRKAAARQAMFPWNPKKQW